MEGERGEKSIPKFRVFVPCPNLGGGGVVSVVVSIKTSFCILGKAHFDLMRGVRRKKRKVKYKKMKTKSPGRSRHPRFLR